MTNSKHTKKALYSSVLSLLLCFVMLIGTTFAWFTDNASTGVNTIQAGELKIELLDDAGKSLEGGSLAWQKAADGAGQDVLWEPGATYNLQEVTVKNNGNLALKYKIVISGINGDAELNDVIDWTIKVGETTYDIGSERHLKAGESEKLTISGTMQTTADNQYQGLSIEGASITVYATQDTIEYDSTTNEYDQDATLPNGTFVSNAAELAKALSVDGANVILMNDITVTDWTPVAVKPESIYTYAQTISIDGAGYTISGLNAPLLAGNTAKDITITNLTIKDSQITTGNENGLGRGAFVAYRDNTNAGTLTMKNCSLVTSTVTATEGAGALIGYAGQNNVVIDNCSVRDCTITGKNAGGLIGFCMTDLSKTNTITNCVIENNILTGDYTGQIAATVNNNGTLTIEGCTFTGDAVASGRAYATVVVDGVALQNN